MFCPYVHEVSGFLGIGLWRIRHDGAHMKFEGLRDVDRMLSAFYPSCGRLSKIMVPFGIRHPIFRVPKKGASNLTTTHVFHRFANDPRPAPQSLTKPQSLQPLEPQGPTEALLLKT